MLNAEETYYDPDEGHWTSDRLYMPDEAHDIAQSLHRYRLFTFSNFFTTVEVVDSLEANLKDILLDAQPGSAMLVIGGKGSPYPDVYKCLDKLATRAGFQRMIDGAPVSSSDSEVADRIYEEEKRHYEHVRKLVPSMCSRFQEPRQLEILRKEIRDHYEVSRTSPGRSDVRAYRKYRFRKSY
ncbi:MAG: hypothetical protein F4X34_04710 [Chloroflexi bacterium]|nr:hypothetical protein [Chloroflexota bacterium]